MSVTGEITQGDRFYIGDVVKTVEDPIDSEGKRIRPEISLYAVTEIVDRNSVLLAYYDIENKKIKEEEIKKEQVRERARNDWLVLQNDLYEELLERYQREKDNNFSRQ